jgi:predicted enzyme related to lactoylglutathione lyase
MFEIEICVDVPDLERGVRFYSEAFGFTKLSEPYAGVVVLAAGAAKITLLQKFRQTKPSPYTQDVRRYDRHWTPVHLDFHVDDVKASVAIVERAGATAEQVFEEPEHGLVAFCADPFGHGFCLLERKAK